MRNCNKSPKIRNGEESGESDSESVSWPDHYQELIILPIGKPDHNSKFQSSSSRKFQWNQMITFVVILLTEWQTARISDRQTETIA